ncbi:MAG: PHP domain-containing protein [Lachnospiraceae bacterium]|nr:PHP domain-containing protein [Lachnospiraceae bacterium]
MKDFPAKIDLHMHTVISDGTDRPEEILEKVKAEGIGFFSVTDHDALKGGAELLNKRQADDPSFITGVEFSCRDEKGKYHILGYHYDLEGEAINALIKRGHGYRLAKTRGRVQLLGEMFGFYFPEEEVEALLSLENPGKPHIGNLMVKYGFAESKEQAIKEFINKTRIKTTYIRPEEAIEGILKSGGIPVLAHPSFGDGEQLILGEEMEERLRKLMEYGLEGLEAFYSGFTPKLSGELLSYADKYDLLVTAGSDYHGSNKLVRLGDTGLENTKDGPKGLLRFLEQCL